MNQAEVFKNAIWIGTKEQDIHPFFRKSFNIHENIKGAEITILGYGTFIFFVNGKRGTEDLYLPVTSDFEERNFPVGEVTGHRAYVYKFDIKELLKYGKNTLSVMLGNSWYNGNYSDKKYGSHKLCYCIKLEYENGEVSYVVSSTEDKYTESYIKHSNITGQETHDYTNWNMEYFLPEFDDGEFKSAVMARAPKTEFYYANCPPDRVIEDITPDFLGYDKDGGVIYDAKKNISGFPVVLINEGQEEVTVTFSEEICPDNSLNPDHMHSQEFKIKTCGNEMVVKPETIWFGFRYFKIKGNAKPLKVCLAHADVEVSSSFECSDKTITWIYEAYKNTQRCNMHFGVPSDCPHLEKRGYTGDGQLTCRAAMRLMDMKSFYAKWIEDISDCQDKVSGHVQYTAPYTRSGGGPGGWGCAIVVLPYEYYKYYGDDSFARKMYPQMLRYFDYLEAHSENLLVCSDREGEWCLGDWCTLIPVALPAPFINNYFYIKSMGYVIELAKLFGHEKDIPMLEKRIAERKRATEVAYMNTWDGNFIANIQGANAFALDIGMGDERTKENFINYYESLGYYDTGIFGTDIITRLLFEYKRGDIAYRLLTASEPFGFGKWEKDGATTLWEYWDIARSHSHPMFGAVCAYFFEYILGIRQKDGDWGQKELIIDPAIIESLSYAKGHVTTPYGKVSVCYEKCDSGEMKLKVSAPDEINITIINKERLSI